MIHRLWLLLVSAMLSWHQGKLFIEHSLSISHDSLHIIIGVMLWLLFALLFKRPLTTWLPWQWLLAVILWNEAVDLWIEHWPDPGEQYGESAKDILLTLAVPTLIMVAARLRPDLFRGGGATKRRR